MQPRRPSAAPPLPIPLHLTAVVVCGLALCVVAGCEIFEPGGDALSAARGLFGSGDDDEASRVERPEPQPVALSPGAAAPGEAGAPGKAGANSGAPAGPALPSTAAGCTPVGEWSERWSGKAARDGAALEGRAEHTIRVWRGRLQGIGRVPGKPAHGSRGAVKLEGERVHYELIVGGGVASGDYDCGFTQGACDRLECSVSMKDRFGRPNLSGEAVFTRIGGPAGGGPGGDQ